MADRAALPLAPNLSTDVLIVGAGLAGAVAARRLAQAGIDVLCLEQGARPDPATYPDAQDGGELMALGPWHPSPNIRRGAADYPIDDADAAMKPMLFNGVGGSTVLYGAQWMRFLPSDFHTRTLDGVGDDWPITYAELAPFYDRVERDFGVAGLAGDPAIPGPAAYPLPPLPIGRAGLRVAAGHEALGWHWWPGSNAIASVPYDGRAACTRIAACGSGCPTGAKASVDVTHWPVAERHGARLMPGARVARLTHDAAGRADGAIFRDVAGRERRVTARTVLLAAGAIGTPRLLLASATARFPDGLANASGLVGRRLMMHPFTRAVGCFDADLRSTEGPWGQTLYSLEFAETRRDTGFVRGAKWNLGPSGGPLDAALFPWPGEAAWGAALHRRVARWVGRTAVWGIICEDLPDAANRVELHPDATDAQGVPVPRIHYRIDDNTQAMLAFNRARACESLQAAGATEVVAPALMPEFGWHLLGTCRMGADPADAVVDPFGAAHDVPGLHVIDGSTLVTSSCVNPGATIAALALRTADRLAAAHGDTGARR